MKCAVLRLFPILEEIVGALGGGAVVDCYFPMGFSCYDESWTLGVLCSCICLRKVMKIKLQILREKSETLPDENEVFDWLLQASRDFKKTVS